MNNVSINEEHSATGVRSTGQKKRSKKNLFQETHRAVLLAPGAFLALAHYVLAEQGYSQPVHRVQRRNCCELVDII